MKNCQIMIGYHEEIADNDKMADTDKKPRKNS